jgi:hypothetical protein
VKRLLLALLFLPVLSKAQSKIDTIKCYVQVMIPASDAVGLHRESEVSQIFLNGGIVLYTKPNE